MSDNSNSQIDNNQTEHKYPGQQLFELSKPGNPPGAGAGAGAGVPVPLGAGADAE